MTLSEAKEVLKHRYESRIGFNGTTLYHVEKVVPTNFEKLFLVCFEPRGIQNKKTGKRGIPYAGPFGRRYIKCAWPTEKEFEAFKKNAPMKETSSSPGQSTLRVCSSSEGRNCKNVNKKNGGKKCRY